MDSLKDFARAQAQYCFGEYKEAEDSFAWVEAELQVALPNECKWFLAVCGYGECQAIPDLSASVADTRRFRESVGLPTKYLVLDDRHDSGAVLLDVESPTGTVIWVDTHALRRIATGALTAAEYDSFPDFASWVRFCVERAIDEEQS